MIRWLKKKHIIFYKKLRNEYFALNLMMFKFTEKPSDNKQLNR